jgi:3-dehydroquinate synthase
MKQINIPLKNKEYNVLIENGILKKLHEFIDITREIVVITDDFIPNVYIKTVTSQLKNYLLLKVKSGEESKSIKTVNLLIEEMLEKGVSRGTLIIALGGGVVGDIAGFIASIYMRGVDFIQIPTTLLSQIDSSVGGKVGVNSKKMKNAIGSIKQPKLVLIDPSTLKTLNKRQLNSGLAEMIKYALIASKQLYKEIVNKNAFNNIEEKIEQCIKIKSGFVQKDEYDYGIRQMLNFGHTIGHAFEKDSNYQLLHGEAVGLGILYMTKNRYFYPDLIKAFKYYGLPTTYEYNKDEILNLIKTDKKFNGSTINIIEVKEVGNGYIKAVKLEDLLERL